MLRLTLLSLLLFLSNLLFAQHSFSGNITDTNGQAVIGAYVLLGEKAQTVTDEKGYFEFNNIPKGTFTLRISHISFERFNKEISIPEESSINAILTEQIIQNQEVTVSALRAGAKTPTTFQNISKKELNELNLGQDLPFLLNLTPSSVSTSDAGAGVGYTGIRIRGSDATRINVTINGIPINDSESHGTFWVNMPDLASSVESIQIQRGVGTSTNGSGAFGASVNIETNNLKESAYAEASFSGGSFNTYKTTLMFGSGLLNDHFIVEGRLSKITSDGYVDRARSDLKSLNIAAAYTSKDHLLKFILLSGRERTYQAWYGVSAEDINTFGRTHNWAGYYYNQLGEEGYYDNQVDNYGQDHYQLLYTFSGHPNWKINTALHYTKGEGYYEEYHGSQPFSDYYLDPIVFQDTIITETDLIRRKWLDNDFYGATFSAEFNPNAPFQLTFGGAINRYDGDHFGEIVWARFTSQTEQDYEWYRNTSVKDDYNFYIKGLYDFGDRFSVFGDLQLRMIDYKLEGIFDGSQENRSLAYNFNFLNPKLGFNYAVSSELSLYASYAMGRREPVRSDFVDAPAEEEPQPEKLNDFELGLKTQGYKFAAEINGYFMYYVNQLVLTGAVNDVGGYIRQNAGESYRTGIEISGIYKFSPKFNLEGNLSLSRNRIEEFNTVGTNGLETYEDTQIAFSPNTIAALTFNYSPAKNLSFNLMNKYVGSQYLDNTQRDASKLDDYLVNDLKVGYNLDVKKGIKSISFDLLVNNIFDQEYINNGYMWGDIPYYYPQAGRNFLAGMTARF
ncbi:TonB-dependent receptor [Marinigracilibium pacificum]|uniref:TonB-dependent receptor n=1 Tax=Marinigracilibium pacificum TaxID=2729599 RepID=A0A848IX40_9BACT|nr:TonB-dependent receptor [Marinigracilibium pacificum]NMM46824.1 TonB-dependent receptor [Marinigracilibium pacificum]